MGSQKKQSQHSQVHEVHVDFEADIPLIRGHPIRTGTRTGEVVQVESTSARSARTVSGIKAVRAGRVAVKALPGGRTGIGTVGTDVSAIPTVEVVVGAAVVAVAGVDSVARTAGGVAGLALRTDLYVSDDGATRQTVPPSGVGEEIKGIGTRSARARGGSDASSAS